MDRRTAEAQASRRRRAPDPAHARPDGRPRRPKRRGAEPEPAAALPDDDRFAPHPGETIDTVYVIARAVDLVLARPREVLGVMLASVVISAILLLPVVSFDVLGLAGLEEPMHPARLTVILVLGWACGLLLQAPLVGSAIEVHTTRRGLFLQFLRRGTAHLPQLMLASLAVLGITVVTLAAAGALVAAVIATTAFVPWDFVTLMLRVAGMVAVMVVAMRVITAFALVVPVIVVERLAPGDALRRAWTLGWPNSFPILMALLLPSILAQIVLFVTGFMPATVMITAAVVLGLALAIYQSVVAPVAYIAIREYVDGIDPARLLARSPR